MKRRRLIVPTMPQWDGFADVRESEGAAPLHERPLSERYGWDGWQDLEDDPPTRPEMRRLTSRLGQQQA